MKKTHGSPSTLPAGFAGGTPQMWDEYMAEGYEDPRRPFRSAPDRAILDAAIAQTRLRPGDKVLELGCGFSELLTRIALATHARVAGVDFSEKGVERTRHLLSEFAIDESEIVLGTIDSYVPDHRAEFDAVVSFGLVEHFADLRSIVDCHFTCAKPGGRVFISAPNLASINLAWARRVAPALFTWHRPISPDDVVPLCRSAGGADMAVDYLGGPRLFASPYPGPREQILLRLLARTARKAFNGTGELLYRMSPSVASRLGGARLSPFFAVAATKPG
jgi:2-polyprenyl-3-methyl-5-hydroxy-6-metoxy-1,4-benzoquinol methylase